MTLLFWDLQALPQDTIQLRFLLSMTGDVSVSDIDLAQASEAVILGFNVQVTCRTGNNFFFLRSFRSRRKFCETSVPTNPRGCTGRSPGRGASMNDSAIVRAFLSCGDTKSGMRPPQSPRWFPPTGIFRT